MTRTTRTQRKRAQMERMIAQHAGRVTGAAHKPVTLAELKAIRDANGYTRKLAAIRKADAEKNSPKRAAVAQRVALAAQQGTLMIAAKSVKKDATKKAGAITPESYAKAGTEHAHQVAVFMWAAQEAPKEWRSALQFMFAIPNGGERNKAVAARLKAEGVKSGVPDIMLPVRKGRYAGLFIELKKPRAGKVRGGKATLEQNAWITVLNGLGYSAHVCEGCLAAIAVITVYMGLGPFETMADMGTN